MICFRQCDWRWPFLWESSDQPPARWHGAAEGPVHYLADTPDGAWAELIRHEEITDPEDLASLRRNLWAVQVTTTPVAQPRLPAETSTGPFPTYPDCQEEARRLRAEGEPGLVAPSAALKPGAARGLTVDRGLRSGPPRDGRVVVLFGRRNDLIGWLAAEEGCPPARLLGCVSHL